MMHQKASQFVCGESVFASNVQIVVLFKDDVTASEVLETEDPAGQKKLGRKVRGFDEDVWKKHRMQIVKAASKAKVRHIFI